MSALGTIFKIVAGKKTEHQVAVDRILNIGETLKQEHRDAVHAAMESLTKRPNGGNGVGGLHNPDPLDNFFTDIKGGSA